MNIKIDFFIAGTQKAGTTSLYNYLIQNPEIYFSEVKELRYFIDEDIYARGENYLAKFFYKFDNDKHKCIGSSHVHMLPCKDAPQRVYEYNPNAKLIFVLRDPIERAISAFDYAVKNGWERKAKTLDEAFLLESKRLESEPFNYDIHYFNNGLYSKHLLNWKRFFPAKQIFITTDISLKNRGEEVLTQIFNFLGVSILNIDTSIKYNEKSRIRSRFLQNVVFSRNGLKKFVGAIIPGNLRVWIRAKIFKKIVALNSVPIKEEKRSKISQDLLEKLNAFFKADIEALVKEYDIVVSNSSLAERIN